MVQTDKFIGFAWRSCLALAVSGLLGVGACSPATPTRTPATAMLVAPGTSTAAPVLPTLPEGLAGTATAAPMTLTAMPVGTAVVDMTSVAVKVPTALPATATVAPQPTARPSVTGGRIYYGVVTDTPPQFHSIWSVKTDGSGAIKLLDGAAWPAIAPNGKNLAFFQLGVGGKNSGLYVGDASGGSALAAHLGAGVCCLNWSQDSNWIVFANSAKPNQPGGPLMMVKADGVYKNPTIVDLHVVGTGPAFSPDGKLIVYSGSQSGSNTLGLMVAGTDGSGTPRQITRDNGGNAAWSPRGDKIVYQAPDDTGHNQVFVVNVDGSGRKQLTHGKGNDGQPTWSRDGGTIYWRSDQNATAWAIMAMSADGSNVKRLLASVPPDPNLWGWEALSVGP